MLGLKHSITAEKSICEFHNSLIKLAINFKNFYILIKPKIISPYYYHLFNKIKAIDNLEIITDIKKYNPYELASCADLLIGKHTSILEEAIAAGKLVIVYDNDNYLCAINYILSDKSILVENYDQMVSCISRLFNQSTCDNSKFLDEIRKNYFVKSKNGYVSVKNELQEIYYNRGIKHEYSDGNCCSSG